MISLVAMLALSPCLEVRGDRITASDVARAVPGYSRLAPDQVISYSPAPGLTRVFSPAELRQWLSRQNIASDIADPICFEWPMRTVSADEVRAAMLASLPPESDIAIASSFTHPVPVGSLHFPLAGIAPGVTDQRDWSGFVEYAPGKRMAITVRVTLRVPFTRVVTTKPIRAGERITPDKLRFEQGTGAPVREEAVTSIEQTTAMAASRFLPQGTTIVLSMLTQPPAVSRGDTLQVDVLSGNARLRFDGLAEASAASGAIVPVRMKDTGRLIHARVTGRGQVVLDLSNTPEKR